MKQLTEEQRYNISAYLQSGKSRTEISYWKLYSSISQLLCNAFPYITDNC